MLILLNCVYTIKYKFKKNFFTIKEVKKQYEGKKKLKNIQNIIITFFVMIIKKLFL